METKNSPKLAKNFFCKKCDYNCSKESDYKKHLSTRKHKVETKLAKTRHIFVNVELNIKQDQDYLNINKNKNVK